MSEVFIAYQRLDSAFVARLRSRLESLDVPVFMDIDIGKAGGEANFIKSLDHQLSVAKAVLVLWTQGSVANEFVLGEAEKGRNRKVLVAACQGEGVTKLLPAPFNMIQSPDLSTWFERDTPHDDAQWQILLGMLGSKLGRPGLPALAGYLASGTKGLGLRFISEFPQDISAPRVTESLEAAERSAQAGRIGQARAKLKERVRDAEKMLSAFGGSLEGRIEDIRAGRETSAAEDPLAEFDRHLTCFEALTELGGQAEGEWRHRASEAERSLETSRTQIAELGREVERLTRFETDAKAAAATITELTASVGALDKTKESLAATEEDARRLKTEVERLTKTEAEAAGLTAEVARLKKEQAERVSPLGDILGVRRQDDAGISRPRAAALMVLGLLVGIGLAVGALHWAGFAQPDRSVADIKAEYARRDAEIGTREAALQAQTEKLARDREAVRVREAALAERERKFAMASQPGPAQAAPAQPAPSQPASASVSPAAPGPAVPVPAVSAELVARCDQLAALPYDPDRPSRAGSQDNHVHIPEEAIPACLNAKSASADTLTRRRMMVNLGRAYAGRGDREARAGNTSAADALFSNAVAEWTEAAKLRSATAYQLLGAYYRQSFRVDQNYVSPANADRELLLQNYSRSADLGSPMGMIVMAYYMSFPDWFANITARDDKKAREYLDRASRFDIPYRSYIVGLAELYGRARYDKNEEIGLAHIAFAACRGDAAAKAFFRNTQQYRQSEPHGGQCGRLAAAD